MIELTKQKFFAFLLVAAVVGGAVGYHLAPPAKDRPVLRLLQKVLKAGSLLWFFSQAEDEPKHHLTHSAQPSGDYIDHRRAF